MRSFLIVLITVCVLGLGFGVYWMFAGTSEAPELEAAARARTRRTVTTLPTASDSVIGPGRDVWVLRFDQNTGELASRFRAARYEPQKGGRWQVYGPEAEFFLHNGQVLRIVGEKGTVNVDDQARDAGDFAAAQQMPRGGELQNVRLLLLPRAGAQRPTMTLSMKNASFDNESFRISTEAYRDGGVTVPADRVHVKVRGDDYEFDGYGLRLQYNELDRRLEYLRITHGERLLIKNPSNFMKGRMLGAKPEDQQAKAGADVSQILPSARPIADLLPGRALAGVGLVVADEGAVGNAVKSSKKPRKSEDPLDAPFVEREEPVYRATFKDNVNVTQSGKQLAVAQDLVVDFLNKSDASLGGVVAGEKGPTTRPRRPSTRPVGAERSRRGATTPPTTAPAAEPIEVHWTGSLTITPLPGDRPERIAPGESIVRLVSSPKRPVEVTRQTETGMGMLKAGMLTHWTMDQGMLLEEAAGIPVEMIDSKGAHIVTRSMRFSERDGTAVLQGRSRALLPVGDETADAAAREMMDVAWQERCTLHLAGGGLDEMILSRADLQGKVAVNHPQLKLKSQTLQLLFDDQQQQPATQPVQADGKRQSAPPLRQLDATGDVHCVIARPDETEQTLDCQSLKLLTARTPTGELFARSIVAMGQVHAVDAKQDLTAGYVSVSLAAPTRPTTRPAAGELAPGEVESLLAHDHVVVKTVDGKTAEADQLVVEIRDGQPSATLHGRPAVVTHDRNRLIADAIQMMSATQQISVPGPGRMEGVQKQDAGRPERPVEVTWERSMRADGRRNTIEAFGSVVARSVGADGAVNVAKGNQVRLTTTRPAEPAAEVDARDGQAAVAAVTANKPATRPTGDLDVMADHQIQSILLQDGAQVTSVLSEGGGERMFHVTSASIQYDKAKQKLTIPQEGKLLFADSRPPAKTDAAQAAASDPFGVRGKTAFEWSESLVYDEAASQVVMTGDVAIARLEQSQSADDRLRIEADQVIADLEPQANAATRPAAAAADDLLAPRMQLKQVRALGRVLVNSKKLHVRAETLEYDPSGHLLTVRGTKDQPVEQLDEHGLPVATFDELTYNTETGQTTSKNATFRNRSTTGSPIPARVGAGLR